MNEQPCIHSVLEPLSQVVAATGDEEFSTNYVCEACGQAFTVEEAQKFGKSLGEGPTRKQLRHDRRRRNRENWQGRKPLGTVKPVADKPLSQPTDTTAGAIAIAKAVVLGFLGLLFGLLFFWSIGGFYILFFVWILFAFALVSIGVAVDVAVWVTLAFLLVLPLPWVVSWRMRRERQAGDRED